MSGWSLKLISECPASKLVLYNMERRAREARASKMKHSCHLDTAEPSSIKLWFKSIKHIYMFNIGSVWSWWFTYGGGHQRWEAHLRTPPPPQSWLISRLRPVCYIRAVKKNLRGRLRLIVKESASPSLFSSSSRLRITGTLTLIFEEINKLNTTSKAAYPFPKKSCKSR